MFTDHVNNVTFNKEISITSIDYSTKETLFTCMILASSIPSAQIQDQQAVVPTIFSVSLQTTEID